MPNYDELQEPQKSAIRKVIKLIAEMYNHNSNVNNEPIVLPHEMLKQESAWAAITISQDDAKKVLEAFDIFDELPDSSKITIMSAIGDALDENFDMDMGYAVKKKISVDELSLFAQQQAEFLIQRFPSLITNAQTILSAQTDSERMGKFAELVRNSKESKLTERE